MRSERISGSGMSGFIRLIPKEVLPYVNDRSYHVTGVWLFEEPCGAAVWQAETPGSSGRLLSIYVDPPCRRIGAGGMLLKAIADEMREEGISELKYIFPLTGDRRSLVPFFEDMDVEIECMEFPFGSCSLSDVINALENKGLEKAKPCGKAVYELDSREKTILQGWLHDSFSEEVRSFTGKLPPSFVHIDGGELRSALLFSGEGDGVLSLDYVFQKDARSLMGIFSLAADKISESYPSNTRIEAILTNSNAVSLYNSLFGETDEYMTVCSGSFRREME